MSALRTVPIPSREIVYPESEGKPLADNTRQLDWITLLYGNLRIHFADRADEVFVGANQLWYPVEGEPEIAHAPDVYVVLGRPQRHRGSYQQWLEEGIPLTVVFEIRSPSDGYTTLIDTEMFYGEHGVGEYLLYDPEEGRLKVYLQSGFANRLRPLRPVPPIYTSERLGIRFDTTDNKLVVTYPDGRPFLSHAELDQQRILADDRAARERQRADRERQRAADVLAIAERLSRGLATPEDLEQLRRYREEGL